MRCAVVGAGVAGIVATKELHEAGIDVICFEAHETFGGSLLRDAPESLIFTSSRHLTAWSDFPDNRPGFWTKREFIHYMHAYVDHFNIRNCFRFGKHVERIRTLNSGGYRIMGEDFDYVLMAVGTNQRPYFPPPIAPHHHHPRIHHSSRVRRNETIPSGARVLVVGGGESASMIATELDGYCQQLDFSVRDPVMTVHRWTESNVPSDWYTTRLRHTLHHSLSRLVAAETIVSYGLSSCPVRRVIAGMNPTQNGYLTLPGNKAEDIARSVVLHGSRILPVISTIQPQQDRIRVFWADGHVRDYDHVICATGFQLPSLPVGLSLPHPRHEMWLHTFPLHARCWPPDWAIMGLARPNFGSQFPVMELQARLLAAVWTGRCQLPSTPPSPMPLDQYHRKVLGARAVRNPVLVKYPHICDELARTLGVMPNLYCFWNPWRWWELWMGPVRAAHYREGYTLEPSVPLSCHRAAIDLCFKFLDGVRWLLGFAG